MRRNDLKRVPRDRHRVRTLQSPACIPDLCARAEQIEKILDWHRDGKEPTDGAGDLGSFANRAPPRSSSLECWRTYA